MAVSGVGKGVFRLGSSAVRADDADKGGGTMAHGCVMVALAWSFDGATGAYEDKIMSRGAGREDRGGVQAGGSQSGGGGGGARGTGGTAIWVRG